MNSKAHNPVEMAYDIANGIPLCGYKGNRCHSIFHTMFMGGTRRKCTPADFERFNKITEWVKGLQ